MKKRIFLLLSTVLICFLFSCKKESDSINSENTSDFDYLDSTYISFVIDTSEVKCRYAMGFDKSIEYFTDNDSVIIGFGVNAYNSNKTRIFFDFYYKISKEDLILSDTTVKNEIFKVSNFDTLIQVQELRFRNDNFFSSVQAGVSLTYFDKNNYTNATYLDSYYKNDCSRLSKIDLENSYCIIKQRKELTEGRFLIKGIFETNIYNIEEDKLIRLTKGEFCILF